jgi:mycothiol synthase
VTAQTEIDTPGIPSGYAMRHPTRDDLPAIFELCGVADRHDVGETDWTLASFEMEWAMPAFDPAQDTWIIESADGTPVAYAAISRRPKLEPEAVGVVLPEHRGRGLGSALVDLTEARVRKIVTAPGAEGPRAIVQWTHHADGAVATLLEARGYTADRAFWRMSITLGDQEPPAPAWPDSVEMRAMRVGVDDQAVYTTVQTAFRDHWNSSPLPFEEWRRLRMGSRTFDPELWLLAWSGDRLVGASLNADEDGDAWVNTLGVLREARGKGLGMALLVESFRAFHRRGRRRISLGVDASSLTGATRLYERAGMTVDRQYDHWHRDLE